MKQRLLFLSLVVILLGLGVDGWGQTNGTTPVLLDNYDGTGDLTYTENTDAQWAISGGIYVAGTNALTTPEHSCASYDLSNSIATWNLSKTNQNVWIGYFKILRATSGWGTSNYGCGAVLACNNSDFTNASAAGYALVIENGTTDKVTLVKFSEGIKDGATNLPSNSTSIVSVAVDPGTTGFNYMVELLSDGKWKISYIIGAQLSDANAVSKAQYSGGNATSASADETYTGSTYKYIGWVFSHSSGNQATDKANFDNLGAAQTSPNSNTSDIIANTSFTYPTNLAYGSYQGTTPLTTGNSIEVAQFDIRDGGGSSDADALSTTLTGLTLNVANSGGLRRIALFDGTTNVGEVASGATATFSGLTLAAADNGSKTFSVRVSFLSSVTDNQQFSFAVNSATASGSGSDFAAGDAGGAVSSTTGDNNRIEVTASDLMFDVDPSTVSINAVMSPAPTILAVDGNGNVDLDFTGSVTISSTGTISGSSTNPVSAISGNATFSNLIFSASGTGITIEGSATGVNPTGISVAFDVTNPQPEINIKQDVTNIATGGSYGFGSHISGTSTSAITFTIENIGTADLNLTGTPKVVKSGTNASEFTIDETATNATVSASGNTTFTVTFSPTSQGAKTAQLSIDNNDATGSENPYIINITGTGTVSSASDIINTGGYSYTSNVAYASSQTASSLTTGNSVGVNGLTIRDGAGSADIDNLGTTLTAISFTTGGSTAIRTAALFDGISNVSEVAVNGETTISFSGLSITAADAETKDFELRVTYQATVTDNQQITFTVSAVTANAAGSGFAAANGGAAATTATGDINRIEVSASQLAFVVQPSNVGTSSNITPAVTISANDANGNRDLDYVTDILITASGATLTGSPVAGTPVNGLGTFGTLSFSTGGTGVTLSASSGALTQATSSTFNVSAIPVTGEIIINQFSPDYSGNSNEYIELVNRTNKTFDLSLIKIEYQSAAGGAGGAGGTLSGTMGAYQYWLLSPDATITVGQTTELTRDGSITAGFAAANGQLAIRLVASPNTIIDGIAYGTVTLNNLGEGTASASPPTDGGLKRVSEGIDNNANLTDFSTVANASIYLRNSNSVCIASTYTLPAVSYSADVVVSGTAPAVTLSGNTTITGKLSVLSGSLTVGSSQQLTVSGTLTNNATEGIVLKSPLDHGAPGSLIVNGSISGSGTIKAERYVQAYSTAGNGWHLISSPVNNVNIASGTNLAPGGTDDLYAFNETAYEWTNYKPGNVFTTMDNGKGYLVSYTAAATKQFVGTPNNAAVTFTNLTKTAGEGNGWHLIGNPFQSAISWNNGGWTLTNIGGVAKRMSDAGSYSDIQENGIIPAMQGFFVQADNATNTLTIPLSARTHNSAQNWTKSGNANTLLLVAHDPAQAMYQESRLNENPEATEAYDYRFDSRFVPWYAPEFYSVSGEEMLSTNSIPDFSSDNVIPFGFKKNTSEAFYIELKEYPTGLTTYLTDTKTGTEHNFAENAIYSFSSADGDNPNRFLLHFGAVGISEQPASATLKAYVVGGQLYFPLQGEATLEIVDLQGRVLQQSKVIGQGLASQPLQLTAGAYVVRLTSGQNVQTAKVIVK